MCGYSDVSLSIKNKVVNPIIKIWISLKNALTLEPVGKYRCR